MAKSCSLGSGQSRERNTRSVGVTCIPSVDKPAEFRKCSVQQQIRITTPNQMNLSICQTWDNVLGSIVVGRCGMEKPQSFASITGVILFVMFRFASVNLFSQKVYPLVDIQVS